MRQRLGGVKAAASRGSLERNSVFGEEKRIVIHRAVEHVQDFDDFGPNAIKNQIFAMHAATNA